MMCWAIMQTSLHHHSQDLHCTFLTTPRPSISLPVFGLADFALPFLPLDFWTHWLSQFLKVPWNQGLSAGSGGVSISR
jgi:hypothetical protein